MGMRSRRGPVRQHLELSRRIIGNALVVHRAGTLTDEARTLALNVAEDADHDLVVMDLPGGMPITMWESVADVLPRSRRGIRLVIGGRSRETTGLAGQWLSERLNRTVIAPDGVLTPGVGGSLFVHSGRDAGWVRFAPGQRPRWEATRFPRPFWDSPVTGEIVPTSARGLAEPVPAGVWIRPAGFEQQQRQHRALLLAEVPVQPTVLTVLLGSPGHPPLSLDDVARLWVRLPGPVRQAARFVQYGPMSVPQGSTLGQALADLLGTELTFYTGLPMGPGAEPAVRTVLPGGAPGWQTFATQLRYRPGGAGDPAPSMVGHRAPVPGLDELAPAVYWYAPDAVIEVVQSGLLVRSPQAGGHTEPLRTAAVDSRVLNLTFDAAGPDAERMRGLAEDLALRVDPVSRRMARVLPAAALVAERSRVRVGGRAHATIDHGHRPGAGGVAGSATFDEATETLPVGTAGPTASGDGSRSGRSAAVTVVPPPVAISSVAVSPVPASPVSASPVSGPPVSVRPATADSTATVALRLPVAPPVPMPPAPGPVAPPLPPLPVAAPPPATRRPGPVAPPAVADPTGPDPAAAQPTSTDPPADPPTDPPTGPTVEPAEPAAEPRVQPTPTPEAAALLPTDGIEDERAWLRKTLAREYGTMSNSIARVLSEHPGFQGALSRSSAEVLTDAVAVRLYLSPRGAVVDAGLRSAAVGPHVPLARAVVSGLQRLPSHRGPTVLSTSLSAAHWALYRQHRFVTEWGFLHARTAPTSRLPGDTDVLVWSMTARRTRLLEPDTDGVDNRVLFVPGTSFKVLELTEPDAGAGTRGSVLIRELTPTEVDEHGRVDPNRVSLDELALGAMRQDLARWTAARQPKDMPAAPAARFGALPGLVTERGGSR
jgi:hypothetical protein